MSNKIIKYHNIGEILQHVYDSEINVKVGWMWDGGIDYIVGDSGSDYWETRNDIQYTGRTNICEALEFLCLDLIEKYPASKFTEWFNLNYKLKTKI